MDIACQLVEYRYRRDPFPQSVRWHLTARVVTEFPELGEPGFKHQTVEKDMFNTVFALPFSDKGEVWNATQTEYEGHADARFHQSYPDQELA